MSVFDLFRGFFGMPGGPRGGRRDPFFDAMTRDEDDDDDDDDEWEVEEEGEAGRHHHGFWGERHDPLDEAVRFGFSFGPDGVRIREPPLFGHVLREMEEIFGQMGAWDGQPAPEHSGVPRVMPPPPPHQDSAERAGQGSSGNPLRDFMLKTPRTRDPPGPGAARGPRHDDLPFSNFHDIWRRTPQEEHKEDRDLDSLVSSGGLEQILTPPTEQQPPSQPRIRSFFQSVTVSKVVKPDGTVEERRTVRDGQGNEETTVSRSGGPGVLEGPDDRPAPVLPGGHRPFSDMRDDNSLFTKFFEGFK